MSEHRDVVVVGAGISGIDAGYHLQTECPDKSYLILEARDTIGGTWDLFRYPGVRSDSDMFTLGFPFRPWREPDSIADGGKILAYVKETARVYGIDRQIRYGRRVVSAAWSTDAAVWTLRTESGEEYTCAFLYVCTGYYRYSAGYEVDFPGAADFTGRIVHPQHWPAGLDHEGKRVAVIGSGATAVTLVPAMAATAAHVTMVQRSPTHIATLPARDETLEKLSSVLPRSVAAQIIRTRNLTFGWGLYQATRRWPDRVAAFLRKGVAAQLPPDVPVDPHFVPVYNPWDQRLCVVPDGDLFTAMRDGRASVATGIVETFTEKGVRLTDGAEIEADIIVTATGLTMVAYGEIDITVDGAPVRSSELHVYKGMMFGDVPNMAWCVGYTNASWTLRADLTSRYVCRLLNYMTRNRIDIATPHLAAAEETSEPLMNLTSGYVRRAAAIMPKQGARRPWRMRNNYLTDLPAMRLGRIDDGSMTFTRLV